MSEHTNQLPMGFHFSISLDGSEQGFFQEVSGISDEMSPSDIIEAGGYHSKFRIPIEKRKRELVLKRGVLPKASPLATWCEESLSSGLTTPIQTKPIVICLVNKEGDTLKKWIFYKAYPVNYSIADLRPEENDIAIETLEFAYTYFLVDNA